MWLKELKKYIGLFVLGVALIAVYKTFDNFGDLLNWIGEFFALYYPADVCHYPGADGKHR